MLKRNSTHTDRLAPHAFALRSNAPTRLSSGLQTMHRATAADERAGHQYRQTASPAFPNDRDERRALRWDLPVQFPIATTMNAVDRLRRLSTTATVRRSYPLRQLEFCFPAETIDAVVHVALLVLLDVTHLLIPFPLLVCLIDQTTHAAVQSGRKMDTCSGRAMHARCVYALLAGRRKAIRVPRTSLPMRRERNSKSLKGLAAKSHVSMGQGSITKVVRRRRGIDPNRRV